MNTEEGHSSMPGLRAQQSALKKGQLSLSSNLKVSSNPPQINPLDLNNGNPLQLNNPQLRLSDLTEVIFAANFPLNIKQAKTLLDKTYQYPARYEDAMIHRRANKLGLFSIQRKQGQQRKSGEYYKNRESGRSYEINRQSGRSYDSNRNRDSNGYKHEMELEVCPCCHNKAIKEDFPICYPTYYKEDQRNQLPEGVVNYFLFVKMAICYLLMRVIIIDIYLMWAGSHGSYCKSYATRHMNHHCSIMISPYNLKSEKDQNQLNYIDFMVLAYNIFSIVFFITFRIFMNQQQRLYSPLFFSDSEYTVLLENIPSFLYEERTRMNEANPEYEKTIKRVMDGKVQEWLDRIKEKDSKGEELQFLEKEVLENIIKKERDRENTYSKHEGAVVAVNICFDLNQLQNINRYISIDCRLRDQLIEEYSGTDQDNSDDNKQFLSHIPNQIGQLNNMFIDLNLNFLNPTEHFNGFKLTHFTGKAFVSFNYQHYRDYFIRQYENNPQFLKISQKYIKISYANKPSDVNWYNMKVSDGDREKSKLFTTAVLIMLLMIAFTSHFFMHKWRVDLGSSVNTGKINTYLGTFLTFSQSIMIGLLNMILSAFIQFLSRLEKHKTESDLQYSMAEKTIISQTLNTVVIYSIVYLIYPLNPLSAYGIANTIGNLVMVIGIGNIVSSLILPSHWFWEFVRYLCLLGSDTADMFQIEYNRLLELPAFTYNNAYAFYIIYTFVISFYGYIAPWTTSILLPVFFLQYWLDKFNLFKRYSYNIDIGYSYSQLMISIFELSMLAFAVSHFLWDQQIHFTENLVHKLANIASIAVVVLYLLNRKRVIKIVEKRLLNRKKVINISSYREKLMEPHNTNPKMFATENPAHNCFKSPQGIAQYHQRYRRSSYRYY